MEEKNNGIFTQGDLKEKRRKERIPDISFDVDGDGSVSPLDYFIAKRYDKNQDGKLDAKEKILAQEFMNKDLKNFLIGGETHGAQRPLRLLQVKGKPIYDNDYTVITDAKKSPGRTKSELEKLRKQERIDIASKFAEKHIKFKKQILEFERKENRENLSSRRIKILKTDTRENASRRDHRKRDLSLDYYPCPKYLSKSELDSVRRQQNIDDLERSFNYKHKSWIDQMLERENSMQINEKQMNSKSFKEIIEKQKKEDFEHHAQTFVNYKLGVHGKELPSFSENCKEYWEFSQGYTPSPTHTTLSKLKMDRKFSSRKSSCVSENSMSFPQRFRSVTPEIPLKPNEIWPIPEKPPISPDEKSPIKRPVFKEKFSNSFLSMVMPNSIIITNRNKPDRSAYIRNRAKSELRSLDSKIIRSKGFI
ncbi:unnamed protein product [Blepharisma stoltei]|uniref:EF-hand domain-containing protein n=1 Tax=Blepharisma stoltei TaxID=1481888 RepID=A0AAU9JZP4_9CILI|nr:unnamed protein product [Blepharisma stoltei]